MIKNGKMTLLIHIVLTLFTILAVLPFILMFMSSITDESMIFQNGYSFIPDKLSADAYRYVLVNLGQIGRAYGVTVFITVSGTAVNLLITAMLAYSLSRPFLPCRRFFNLLVVLTLLFNGGLVPTYLVYTQIFHIKNTVWALLLPNLLMSPFHVILAKTYFINSIPSEIMDAATIDGAGEIRIFFRLVLPLAKPMIVTIGLFSGIAYWNDWMNSLYYITNVRLIGIQSYLNRILSDLQYLQSNEAAASMSGDISFPGMSIRMAIATMAILPIVILFTIFQKHFVRGIAMGALKGKGIKERYNGMNLLVVDDEIYAIEGIRLLLDWKKNGIDNIFDAASIAEAKDIFSREKIDMLLCDIELVEENGLDLLVWMNEQGYRTKTVFLTCHEVFGYAQKALQQGAVNYILKPARPEQMIQVINQVKELLEKEEEDPVVGLIKSYIPEKTEKSDFLKHLDSFLLENIEGDLSRNRIASEMYLNADYMGRLLKKETGLSLSEYIGKKKVTVASILLRTTTMPIIDVAQKVGIQELSYFFRLFKKETGLTPKEFRKTYTGKGDYCNAEERRKEKAQK